MKKLLSILAFLLVSSCASTSAYNGPRSDRAFITVTSLRHFVTDDPRFPARVETHSTAHVTNPSDQPVTVLLDCTATTTVLQLAARTTAHVLLDPKDSYCEVR